MKCGVVVFPGSTGDHDVYYVLKHGLGQEVQFLWHDDPSVRECELVVLPGGYSFDDRPRPGAKAAKSAIMKSVKSHSEAGGLVLGVGNGFQILLEAGLLPGALKANGGEGYLARHLHLRVERRGIPGTREYRKGAVVRWPAAHGYGRYQAPKGGLEAVEEAGQIAFRYCSPKGEDDPDWNPVESEGAVAGICNKEGNVLGLMAHPERCADQILECVSGLDLFSGLVADPDEGGAA